MFGRRNDADLNNKKDKALSDDITETTYLAQKNNLKLDSISAKKTNEVISDTNGVINSNNKKIENWQFQPDEEQRLAINEWEDRVRSQVMAGLDPTVAATLDRATLKDQLMQAIASIANQERYPLSQQDQLRITEAILADMVGVGPIQPLLDDADITDIMVNGPDTIYVERFGKLEKTNISFRDEASLRHIARRIASDIGRRIDDSSPLVDARLADGSRVNIIIPPLAIDGTSISIRKFSKQKIDLDNMVLRQSLSAEMAQLLRIATTCRLNIIISGGTGAGKTTLLNAISHSINYKERVITIEDAAELQLQQPHVVRLETRPKSTEGTGEMRQDQLLKNSLRMRPDRIIVGEVRGEEAFEMMQAMNTGHDGSMSTLHSNSPTDALIRLENMLLMSHSGLPLLAIRRQIASAVNIVIQVSRMQDGVRRITSIHEITGMEQDTIISQELFGFDQYGLSNDGRIDGEFVSRKILPRFSTTADHYGLRESLLKAIQK